MFALRRACNGPPGKIQILLGESSRNSELCKNSVSNISSKAFISVSETIIRGKHQKGLW
jgi:hypothetical protein